MMTRKTQIKKWKFPNILFVVFLLFLLYLYGNLFYIALFNNLYGIDMKAFAATRNTVKEIIKADRGTIYDVNGNTLALSVNSYKLVAYLDSSRTINQNNPQHVVDKEMTAEKLATALGADKNYILSQLNQNLYQTYFGTVGSGITEIKKDEIAALNLPGIDFEKQTSRSYPNGDFASYIVGYTQSETGNVTINNYTESLTKLNGALGIELQYNKELSGTDGYLEYQKTRTGYKIPDTNEIREDAVNGSDVYLTIDSSIQRFVESAMSELKSYADPEWATITVMDAKTGDILASGSIPSFDPNVRNLTNYENPLVTYTYEPGSTMKIFSFMCAIQKGTYDGSATYQSGTYTVGENTIGDWNDSHGWGTITYDVGFMHSSNVAAANLVQKYVGRDDYYNCLESYGFGKKTGIELPREQNGQVSFTYPIEVVAASYGQGVTTTPIQNLQALTMIANDGKMLTPHIVSKIVDSTGKTVYTRQVQESEQIVSTATVNKIKDLMDGVVNDPKDNITGYLYKNDTVTVIGKTGTAQYIQSDGTYSNTGSNYIYSFAGMFPKEDPEYIIYASMKRPAYHVSRGIANAVNSIINSIIKYKNIDNETTSTQNNAMTMPSYLNKNVDSVVTELTNFGVTPIVIGDGKKVTNQYPNASSSIVKGDKVFLVTNSTNIVLASIKGWSRTDVQNYCNLIGYKVTFNGYGYVDSYSVDGTNITANLVEKYGIGG